MSVLNLDSFWPHPAVATAVSVPVIVYDIPGRSIVQLAEETLVRLAADYTNITGIKDATADVARPTRIRNLLGADFAQLSGEDATALPYLAAGGHGCISVTANVAPKLLSNIRISSTVTLSSPFTSPAHSLMHSGKRHDPSSMVAFGL